MKRYLRKKRKKKKRQDEFTQSEQMILGSNSTEPVSERLPTHHTSRPLQQAQLLQLQQQQGNQFVQQKLNQATETVTPQNNQVKNTVQLALSEGDKLENLTADRFAGDSKLEDAYDNAPSLKKGEEGDHIAKVQQAFIDLGFSMPISTRKSGTPDGIFGNETWNVVWKFQKKYNLGKDGIIGRETMGKLDALFSKEGPKPPGPVVITDKVLQAILNKLNNLPIIDDTLIPELTRIAQQLALDPKVNAGFLSMFEQMRLKTSEKRAKALAGGLSKEERKKWAHLLEAIDTCIRHLTVHIGITESKGELLGDVTTLTDEQKEAAAKAMVPAKGKRDKPDFKSELPTGEIYRDRVKKYLEDNIQKKYDRMVEGKGPEERKEENLHPWERLEEIANAAKVEVDVVFGNYAKAPPLKAGVNLKDQWEDENKANKKRSPAQKRETAENLLKYFITAGGSKLREINREHGADINRKTTSPGETFSEFEILQEVRSEILSVDGMETKLLEIERGWPATQGSGVINLQRWKQDSEEATRRFFWDMFQVMIHEYLHMLTHPKYEKYADAFSYGSSQYNTLIEGMDSVFTETVWENVESKVSTPAIRLKVEGTEFASQPFDDKVIPEISNRRYPSYNEAMNLASTVGMKNAIAAYFLGVMKGWPEPKKK